MGSVFSIPQSPRHLAERVLTLGVAASAGAFQSFTTDYFRTLQTASPHCDAAEIEQFDSFSDVIEELCAEDRTLLDLDVCNSATAGKFRCKIHGSSDSLQQAAVWRSRTVEAKKRYVAMVDQARRKAVRFRRRFDLYGPPDWVDPALALLTQTNLLSGNSSVNVVPSTFPFAAPHIVISPPAFPHLSSVVAPANGLQCQDHDSGNRLIVAQAPSNDGPLPLVINSGRSYPFVLVEFTAGRSLGHEDMSSCERRTVEENSDDSALPQTPPEKSSFQNVASFWIDEDEDMLPALPDTW